MSTASVRNREYLKTKNIPIAIVFILWCISLYLSFFAGIEEFWDQLQLKYSELSAKDGLIMTLMPVLVLVLSGIFSSELKAKVVFWKLRHALPGHRAFTKLAPADPRLNLDVLRKSMGNFPSSPEEQNAQWYRLYRKVEDAPPVKHAHWNFLLARDLCSISLVFAVMGTVGLFFGGLPLGLLLTYFVTMILHYLVLLVVARNHGNRFVCNVLAEYMTGEGN